MSKNNHELIESAIEYIKTLFADNFGGHDADHTLRVFANAQKIAAQEADCDMEVVLLAALLHDADDHKLFNTENNSNARAFLSEHDIPQDEIETICQVINSVSFSKNRDRALDSLEAKIVQDADRLDAIGAVGAARTFAYGGEHGRGLDDSIEHFHEKLLLLKDMMQTESARAMAEKRHQFMERFLEEYAEEVSFSASVQPVLTKSSNSEHKQFTESR